MEMKKKDMNPHKILNECFDRGLEYALDISTNTETFNERLKFADKYKQIFVSAGLSVGKAEASENDINQMLISLENQLELNKDNPKLKSTGRNRSGQILEPWRC